MTADDDGHWCGRHGVELDGPELVMLALIGKEIARHQSAQNLDGFVQKFTTLAPVESVIGEVLFPWAPTTWFAAR